MLLNRSPPNVISNYACLDMKLNLDNLYLNITRYVNACMRSYILEYTGVYLLNSDKFMLLMVIFRSTRNVTHLLEMSNIKRLIPKMSIDLANHTKN